MQERQVTIEGTSHPLPDPFLVVATQNPIEMEGTFALPEAQRDRFLFKLNTDLPDRPSERQILDRFDESPNLDSEAIDPAIDAMELYEAQSIAQSTHVAESIREYILDLVNATRTSSDVEYGASPRATLAFLNVSKARAAIRGRDYVIPDDVKQFAIPILNHRVILNTGADLSEVTNVEVVREIVEGIEPPGAETAIPESK
ncbi:MAG: AAA family ATPase, partial [Halobacteriaceae archaeon]